MVIEADQNAGIPQAEGDAEAGMEGPVRAKVPKVPVEVAEVRTVQMRLEVVRVAMAAMEKAVVAVPAVTAAQEPVMTMTTVPAPGQQHHAVRIPCVFGSKRQHRRAYFPVSAPRRCRRRQEQTRQQHRYECRDEPHDSLLFFHYNSVGKAGATIDRNARGLPAADTKDFCDCTGRPGFKAEKPLVSKG
jgi:hypothetical protein